jgi:hypothetical protein
MINNNTLEIIIQKLDLFLTTATYINNSIF